MATRAKQPTGSMMRNRLSLAVGSAFCSLSLTLVAGMQAQQIAGAMHTALRSSPSAAPHDETQQAQSHAPVAAVPNRRHVCAWQTSGVTVD